MSSRLALADVAHWGASAALSFARGLNDTPKIVALGVAAWIAGGWNTTWLFGLGTLSMALGSYLYGRRVTSTLAERVTDIAPMKGLAASSVAAFLVLLASVVALPVSTTHVSTGAIVGAGLGGGGRRSTGASRAVC